MQSFRTIKFCFFIALFFFLGVVAVNIQPISVAEAQADLSASTVTKKTTDPDGVVQLDDLGRDTPRGAVKGFFAAVKARHYERGAQYLDLQDIDSENIATQGSLLAKSLHLVLEQKLWIDLRSVSDSVYGNLDDGLPQKQERLGRVEVSGKTFDILLERISQAGSIPVWKFSRATVDDIPNIARRVGFGFLGKFMPASFFEFDIFGIPCAEWLFFLFVMTASMLFFWFVLQLLGLVAKQYKNEYLGSLLDHIRWPLWALLSAILTRAVFKFVAFSVITKMLMSAKTGLYVFGVWLIIRLIDFFMFHTGLLLKQRGSPESINLVKFIIKIVKTCVIFAGVTLWLENIGVKVSALLAGIGIGGIAFALAAQKSIEDFFGALTLIGYRPIKHGDLVRFGDGQGTVEEIGVRYTRIRTLDRTVLNIPNGQLASALIENLSRRDKFRYLNVIDLGYETTPDQLRYILMELRILFYSDARVASDPSCWVRFKEFGPYSLKIEISAWIAANDSAKYREIAEDLNFKILEMIPAAGANFAFPTQVEYHQDNTPIKQDLVLQAEEKVKQWRAQGKLFIDAFPPEEIVRLGQKNKKYD